MKNIWITSILGSFIIISDQITKAVIQQKLFYGQSIKVIDGFFNITYVKNPGAAFGFMANASENVRKFLFLLIPVIACLWLLYLIWSVRNTNKLLCFSYSLILSGAIGNLIDRFTLGYVVDFLEFYLGTSYFPAFNVADSSISIAAGLLILDFLLELKRKNTHAANTVSN